MRAPLKAVDRLLGNRHLRSERVPIDRDMARWLLRGGQPVKGIFSKLYVSSDRGEHWSRYDMPPIATLRIAFTDDSNGEALRNDAHAFTSDLQKFRYRKASNDWVLAEQYPEGCKRVINNEEGQPSFCLTGAGSIVGRNGKDGRVEFTAD